MTGFKQLGRVRTRLRGGLAVRDNAQHTLEDPAMRLGGCAVESLICFIETGKKAGALACVAGGADRLRLDEDRVSITVDEHVLHEQFVPGGFSLLPELLSRTAPEMHGLGRKRSGQRLLIHVAQ